MEPAVIFHALKIAIESVIESQEDVVKKVKKPPTHFVISTTHMVYVLQNIIHSDIYLR